MPRSRDAHARIVGSGCSLRHGRGCIEAVQRRNAVRLHLAVAEPAGVRVRRIHRSGSSVRDCRGRAATPAALSHGESAHLGGPACRGIRPQGPNSGGRIFRCVVLQHMLLYATRLKCGSGRARLPRVSRSASADCSHASRSSPPRPAYLQCCREGLRGPAVLGFSAALGLRSSVLPASKTPDQIACALQVAEWPKVGISIDRSRVAAAMDLLLQLATQYVAATASTRRAAALC